VHLRKLSREEMGCTWWCTFCHLLSYCTVCA